MRPDVPVCGASNSCTAASVSPAPCTPLPAGQPNTPALANWLTTATLEFWVSELATNAIRANPGLKIGLELYTLPGVVMVELWDPSLLPPCRREAAEDDETGRGLSIVDFITDDWGCRWPPTGGKTMWARVPARPE